ncbi:FxsA family protein [Amphibacillus sediminis]|uniref:FxsA family protein n=1 Tax=Amphibacillus sediminis TaxID=360185 RepID=UPI000829C310|nr:FxsA family protein [Amphibacillus sediminis]
MLRWIVLLFILLPALEMGLLVWIGAKVGGWSVIGLIVLTGLIGATLAKQQGLGVLARAQHSLDRGEFPTDQIFDGICILIGAVLLITPGFITDAVGFCLLIPVTRLPLKNGIKGLIRHQFNKGKVTIIRRF